jgi:hypothetical protein
MELWIPIAGEDSAIAFSDDRKRTELKKIFG